EAAVRTVCEPIFSKPLAEISFGQVMLRLFEAARRFDVEIQPQLILLQKTLVNIEGLGRELYPQLDLWKTARPVLRRWMDEQVGARALLGSIRDNLPQLREALRELPVAVRVLSERAAKGRLQLELRSPALEHIEQQLKMSQRQRYWLALGATAFVSGVLVLCLSSTNWAGWALLAAGAASLWTGRPQAPR
ncbi:MAG: ubiquinone biosynthesis regulatory protein kinase UbiB, partial [Woeseiaceae bacterium]